MQRKNDRHLSRLFVGVAAAALLLGSAAVSQTPKPAAATPGDDCKPGAIYGLINYVSQIPDMYEYMLPGQILEFTQEPDGTISQSFEYFSDIVTGVTVGTAMPPMDGLGVSAAECEFFFV